MRTPGDCLRTLRGRSRELGKILDNCGEGCPISSENQENSRRF